MRFKVSSAKRRPFCLGLNVLKLHIERYSRWSWSYWYINQNCLVQEDIHKTGEYCIGWVTLSCNKIMLKFCSIDCRITNLIDAIRHGILSANLPETNNQFTVTNIAVTTWVPFLSLAQIKARLCSANHRPGYWSNLPCDWLSTAWAYSEQETGNGPNCKAQNILVDEVIRMYTTECIVIKLCNVFIPVFQYTFTDWWLRESYSR